ncbi:hypothetical protein Phi46:3_gp050 [Cellulophaga phage phi46:3]|uniref:Uncharacterized protein n=1 Tax=Cellulophaga phage phi46:3 TaxID=1327985 RepID=R9ZZN1_9CAUD|nr:hypothetical protein Phi46:3_gp050 [Cellulophaga phage phi46:3]AGO48794.1 hypothetical protein Phi46:3_gp050 [Cellulophaga phage phi46:3]
MNDKYNPNGTKEEISLNILHTSGSCYVSNEGTNKKPNYHVWKPNGCYCIVDSAYSDITIAVARCNYINQSIKK